MKKVLNQREKIFIFLTIGAIIFSVLFYFFIDPVLSRNGKLNQDISFTRAKLKQYLQLLSQKDYLRARYNQVTLSTGSPELSTKDALTNSLAEIENLAKLANIKIVDIRPQSSSETTYKELLLGLRTQGSIEGYMKFNYSVENSLLLLKIKRFQLNVMSNSSDLEGVFVISQPSLE